MRSLTFLVLTTSAATAAFGQQSGRARCRDCTPAAEGRAAEARAAQVRDSVRVRALGADIERLAIELLNVRQIQLEAQRALKELATSQGTEAGRAQLRQQLERASRESQLLRARLASLCDRGAKPEGYMGITFSATMQVNARPSGAEVFRFAENPTVETVEPGSPAERAGVEKGDEIILLNGQRVVGRDVVFSQILRPGGRLPIRVKRDGDTRDVLLVVGERPASLDNGCPFLDTRIMAAFGDALPVSPLAAVGGIVRAGPAPSGNVVVRRWPTPASAEAPPAAPAPKPVTGTVTVVAPPPMAPVAIPAPPAGETRRAEPTVFVFQGTSSAPMVIAGATIIRTNADLRETFGVKNGVLVLDVARGTPAYNSGLKGGDVIIAAGRGVVISPMSIQRAIESADGSEVTLRIIRKKKAQPLVLRW